MASIFYWIALTICSSFFFSSFISLFYCNSSILSMFLVILAVAFVSSSGSIRILYAAIDLTGESRLYEIFIEVLFRFLLDVLFASLAEVIFSSTFSFYLARDLIIMSSIPKSGSILSSILLSSDASYWEFSSAFD